MRVRSFRARSGHVNRDSHGSERSVSSGGDREGHEHGHQYRQRNQDHPDGLYTIPYLIPGVYTVEVTAPGFQGLKRADITLAVGARLNLPLQLTVGQATTEVTVTGQQELINTADANRGLTFDPVKTQEYPLNGRQSYMLLQLTPGVIFGQEQFGASGFSGTRGWDVNSSYKFNGARAGQR